MAASALFIALGSGAYAASLAPNSVGPKQIQANAVGAAEIAKGAVGPAELKKAAVEEASLAPGSVGQEKLKAAAVGEAQLQANSIGQEKLEAAAVGEAQLKAASIGQDKLKAASVGLAQLQANAVKSQVIEDGSIQLADLSAAATPTLYIDNDEAPVIITTDTAIASLSLPSGAYLVNAGVQAAHTGITNHTRLECYLAQAAPAATLDFAKVRLQPNLSATDSLIFAKPTLQGPTQLPAPTTVTLRCTTVGAASTIDLSNIRLSALRIPTIVAQ
jgi:hypothetical protein